MAISSFSQFSLFLFSLLGGVGVGLFFDSFRALRRFRGSGVVWVGVQDLVFWLFSALSVFLFIYRLNFGQPRWYIFGGIFLGGLFYHLLLGDAVVRLFLWAFRALCRTAFFVLYVITRPFYWLFRLVRPVFLAAGRLFRKFYRQITLLWRRIVAFTKKLRKRLKMY